MNRYANSRPTSSRNQPLPTVCPHCGAGLNGTQKACPECGSDERTGWSEVGYNPDALPDEDEYRENFEREFGKGPQKSTKQLKTIGLAVLAAALAFLFVFGGSLR